MVEGRMIRIDPKTIVTGRRLREVDPDVVDALVAIGLRDDMHPIVVRARYDGDELRPGAVELVAGAHRLAAALQLDLAEISAIRRDMDDETARLVEIEENTVRKGLQGLERARFLAEWKRIYEARNPEARNGAHGGRGARRNEKGIFPFSKIAAEKLGCDASTIKKSVKLFADLAPDVQAMIEGTWIAQKDSELRALAKLHPVRQKAAALELLRSTTDRPRNVRAALALLDGAVEPAPAEKQFERLAEAWARAGEPARQRFIEKLIADGALEDR